MIELLNRIFMLLKKDWKKNEGLATDIIIRYQATTPSLH